MFEGYSGILGYDVVVSSRSGLTHGGCWDHVRRRFFDAVKSGGSAAATTIAETGLSYIQALYIVERDIKESERRRREIARGLYSRSIVEHLRRWLDRVIDSVPPKTLTGKARIASRGERQNKT